LSELRDNFFLFTYQPKSLPVLAPWVLDGNDSKLDWSFTSPKDHTRRLVPFLLSLSVVKAPFWFLTRYYILNVITGAHHLFVFGAKESHRENFFPLLTKHPVIQRADTKKYLHWYFDHAYTTLGYPQQKEESASAFQLLKTMNYYWY
jgi:hypothetical protein